jgi:hypothetical protein
MVRKLLLLNLYDAFYPAGVMLNTNYCVSITFIFTFLKLTSHIKQSLYTPWRRLGGE